MNEKDVTFFSTLLNDEADNVKLYAEEGTLGERIEALNLMRSEDVETLKTNLTKQVKDSHITELVEDAKKGNINGDLYKVIHGATLEMTEKKLAKEFGIDEYEGVSDLVSKAVSKNKGHTDDTKIQELTQKVTDLQAINENLVKEKDELEPKIKTEYESKLLARDKKDMVNAIPFDFSDVEDGELEKITEQRKQIVASVFDAKYDLGFSDGIVVVKDKEGNVIQDKNTLKPLLASDVLKEIPVELGIKLKSPESGGQGGKSSGASSSAPFKSYEEFQALCDQKGILPTSAEAIKIWAERRPK